MSKAVLVIDMPDCCGNCRLCEAYTDEMTGDYYYKCAMRNAHMMDDDERPEFCPLKPLPEKRDLSYGTEGTEWYAYSEGYNACIDMIVGEENETRL